MFRTEARLMAAWIALPIVLVLLMALAPHVRRWMD
jgi:hypothetical protein